MNKENTEHQHHANCCGNNNSATGMPIEEKKYQDPVCGMQVSKSAEKTARFQGIAYYFCSASCVQKFNVAPENYVKAKRVIGLGKIPATTTSPIAADRMQQDPKGAHKDPVCGMSVNEHSQHQTTHNGTRYYFCCASCLKKFDSDPAAWLNPSQRPAPKAVTKDTIFMCPMDPEIEQVGPGICPICGMALEPKEATAEEDNSELDDMRRRFKLSLLFSIPLLMISMGDMLPGISIHNFLGMPLFNWLQCALATPVVLWLGLPFFERALASFKSGHLNMFSLIGVGTGSAYVFSVFALLLPDGLPPAFKMHGMAPLYFEASAVIISLVLLGQVLELRARSQTNLALKALLGLTPTTAIRINKDGTEKEIAVADIVLGDILRIKPGAHIPVDGHVHEGHSYVDEAMLTGEPVAVEKNKYDALHAGSINQQGSLSMLAEKIGKDTLLAHIIAMVNQASRSRAPIQKLADRVAAWFVPAVIAVALIAFGIWAWIGPTPALANGLMAAVSVLIIACPCALGLATPMSITAGMGRGATEGVLIKDAEALELLEKIDTLVLDKTGTLTEGKPSVQQCVVTKGEDELKLMSVALAIEQRSEHPLAASIVNYIQNHYDLKQQASVLISDFKAISGKGVQATVTGETILLGNPALIVEAGIDFSSLQSQITALQANGQTVMLMANKQRVLALFAVSDKIKESSLAAVQQLQQQGIRLILLTGDNMPAAQVIAQQLHIGEVHADVLPADKFQFIQKLQEQGRLVAMAGDGINDAPALAQANVGIAMGTGTDIAMHSAHVVLVKGDLRGIAKARALSVATMKNIRQNLFFAFAYNFIGVPIAAGILYPWFGILLSPMIASAAMSLSSVSVISNALRLRAAKI
ncbi:heavy metal translocating P-type ATPase [Undibacterium jejuense]|uniref:heavy metal translocating P-type ATPase n=1 Tax=Undibacterium jejuense TaxID=1344949 RepID=UPI001C9AB0E5